MNPFKKMAETARRTQEVDLPVKMDEAAINGHLPTLKRLVGQYNRNNGDASEYQVLLWVCANGHDRMVETLLDSGLDVHSNDEEPLKTAARGGSKEVVRLLLERGADVRVGNDDPLCGACAAGKLGVAKILVEAGADVHAQQEYPLRQAAANGHKETVEWLLEQGADVHVRDDAPLVWAANNKHPETVEFLLTRGADWRALVPYLRNPKRMDKIVEIVDAHKKNLSL